MTRTDLSTQFDKISERASDAAGQLRDASAANLDQLKKQVNDAHQRAIDTADRLDGRVADLKDESASRWQALRATWTEHVAAVQLRVDEHKARLDSDVADSDADLAEAYAEDAIDFALASIDEAQSAVLGAIYARTNAIALKS